MVIRKQEQRNDNLEQNRVMDGVLTATLAVHGIAKFVHSRCIRSPEPHEYPPALATIQLKKPYLHKVYMALHSSSHHQPVVAT
jgi:hypothetical protein